MRAWEFLVEEGRSALVSLKQLNKIKLDQRARDASLARRRRLVGIMYRDFGRDLQELEVAHQRLELEKLKADIAATRSGAQADTASALAALSKAGLVSQSGIKSENGR